MTYEVVGVLGRGGMAVVELAVDELGNPVARKRIPLTGSGTDLHLARQRLRREADILSRLAHPCIVPVLDVEDDGADVVIVMPVYAESLADRVRDLGPLDADSVLSIGHQLLGALVAAHRAGVVHRDIKPANVLFSRSGGAALADFGVASTREHTPGLTVDGTVVGTPAWMAPEQARGEGTGPPTDVFALGATLLHALTGVGPYGRGDPALLLWRAASGHVAPLPDVVPPALRGPLAAMLDPDPDRRPSAAAVLGGRSGTGVLPIIGNAVPDRPPLHRGEDRARAEPDTTAPGPRRVLAALLAVVLVGAAIGTGVLLAGRSTGRNRTATATTPTVPACVPLVYQPCGQARPAPHTDGSSCSPGWFDLDGRAANGCEARSDFVPGVSLVSGSPVSANLVPANAVDVYDVAVRGDVIFSCLGSLGITLTAPQGVSDEVRVLHGVHLVGQAISTDGQAATAHVSKPDCIGSDDEDLTVEVSDLAGVSPANFELSRSGGW